MAEPLKNLYNDEFFEALCESIHAEYASFDRLKFTDLIFDSEWVNRELKARMTHIAEVLKLCLPSDYSEALEILKPVSEKSSGFEHMFCPAFVELYGIDSPGTAVYESSINALEHFTRFSSSEFAVRPFLKLYPKEMMQQMMTWASSSNEHVRRLSSEGCRPRLPWAMALPAFKKDPSSVLSVLEKLKDDSSEYVRKSVANNLNDIAKDHPDEVVRIARSWFGENLNRDKLVKHACRTLLKQGNAELMMLFGFSDPSHVELENLVIQDTTRIGESLRFSFQLKTAQQSLGKVRLEYAVDFMKSRGKTARKVFSISESENTQASKEVTKHHSFKLISTRKYYPGLHGLAIIVNGVEIANGSFNLSD